MEPVCSQDFEYHNHTVLVADSNPENLDRVVKYLYECGFKVVVARNGRTAFDFAKSLQPDLIILDPSLPGTSGFETCRLLKEDPSTRHIIVMFMSGHTETQNKVKGFELGAVDYLTRPVEQEELLARVTTHLKLKDLTENLEEKVKAQTRDLVTANNKLHRILEEENRIAGALRESDARYRAVIENSNDGIVILESGRIAFFNQRLMDILGYDDRADLVGYGVETLFHPDDKDRVREYNSRREAGYAVPEQYEARGVTRDGRRVYLGVSATQITYQNQSAVLAFIKDLTRSKRLEGQLQQAQKMEAIGTLASGIAHDFNNILNIIIGHTELALLDDTVRKGTRKYMHRVMDASQRASDLVHQILTFSRQKGMESKPLNVGVLVKETLKMLRASLPSSIEIDQQILDTKSQVMADSTQIHQVVMNLCTNAAHAVPDPGGKVEILLDSVLLDFDNIYNLDEGRYLKLSVVDNGHGIDPACRDRIFEPYFTTKKAGEGTGLGLALVHGIVSGCGGTVQVASDPDEGTAFHVFLPVTGDPDGSGKTELNLEDLPRGSEHILFVDDEDMVVTLYEDMMDFLGYEITATSSSEEAWELFAADPDRYDLVITDLTMPQLSGDELARKMLCLKPETPIIMCTGYSRRLSLEEIRKIGIREYLAKPMILDQLALTIRSVLDTPADCSPPAGGACGCV